MIIKVAAKKLTNKKLMPKSKLILPLHNWIKNNWFRLKKKNKML